jgi:putative GTP pyrophosphokinase
MILERKNGFNVEQIMGDMESAFVMTDVSQEEMAQMFKGVLLMQNLYSAAIREISTKLEILDEEFQVLYSHNPVHHIESRLKSPRAIMEKLTKRGFPFSVDAAKEHISDIAGIRVICHYIDEVYAIADLLSKQDDINIIKKSDYIKSPKPNGYRSLHMVVSVPVFLSQKTERVPVEIQIRTIAMDFWASLEHQIRYKTLSEVKDDLQLQLKDCAEEIFAVDMKMQDIYNQLKLHSGDST